MRELTLDYFRLQPMRDPDEDLDRVVSIIDAMTLEERRDPGIIGENRCCHIAAVAGLKLGKVHELLRQFGEVEELLRHISEEMLRQIGQNKEFPPGAA